MPGWTEIKVYSGGQLEAEGHNFEGGACEADLLMRVFRKVVNVTTHTRKPDAYRRERVSTKEKERTRG